MFDLFDDFSNYGGYGGYGSDSDILNIFSEFSDTVNKIRTVIAFIAIIIGIIQCFWGYKLYRVTLAISGFVTGATVGFIIGLLSAAAMDADTMQGTVTFMLFSMVICGIIGALIAYFCELVGAFLVGFSGVYIASLVISIFNKLLKYNTHIASSFFTSLIPAVIAGILVVKFWKPIIIIYTGIIGAWSIASGTDLGVFFFLLCAVCGIIYQIKSNGGLTYKPETPAAPMPQNYPDQHQSSYPIQYAAPAPTQQPAVRKENDQYPDILD